MKSAIKIFVIFFLCLSLTEETDPKPQLRFLNKLVKIISKQKTIDTIITLQHRQDKNGSLQDWKPRQIALLRSNELFSLEVREFLNKRLLVLVCIDDDVDLTLLNALAKVLENLRQERIILWTQRQPTREFFADILKQVVKFRFLQIIVVAIGHHPSGVLSLHRMHCFPSPRFIKAKNISNIRNPIFSVPGFTYKGMPAIVKIVGDSGLTIPVKTEAGYFPISRAEDMEIIEFARRYNLNLKLYDANASGAGHFDIQLNPRFLTRSDVSAQMEFVNPSSTTSLMVVVPCSSRRSVVDFLRKLGVQTWLLYLLPVYATFVLVETLVLVVTYRMSGEPCRLTNLNPLLNLRAFRAILGLSFPELRRASLSLRQLSLAITIFGFIFSNFFSCKLSAMLTRPLEYPEVRNFKELRASGMTTITETYVHSFIESEIDPQFFTQVIPKFILLNSTDRYKLFLSFNDSYSYIIFSKNWIYFDKHQKSMGKVAFCASKHLVIVQNLPRMYVLEGNSIFKWMLSRFVMYIQETGITEYWKRGIPRFLVTAYNITVSKNTESGPVPLSLQQLKWLWHLLALGYGIATVAFLLEILFKKRPAIGRGESSV